MSFTQQFGDVIKHTMKLLSRIRVETNSGYKNLDHIGKFKMFPLDVHFYATSMVNILSFQAIASLKGVRITMDTVVERAINVEYKGKC
jgi:hypothetical protein